MENEKKPEDVQLNAMKNEDLKEYKAAEGPAEAGSQMKKKKSKLLKIILWGVGILLALLVVCLVFRDVLIENGVRHIGSLVTGTKVQIDSFKSSFNGTIEIKNIKVGNPAGYQKPNAFEIDRIYVKLDTSTLTGREPVVEVVEVTGVRVDMEVKGPSHSNLTDIQKNVERFAGSSSSGSEEKKADPDAPAPLIKKIALTSMSVSLSSSTLRSSVPVPLAPVYLENIGGKGNPIGKTLLEIFNNFMSSVNAVGGTLMGGVEAIGKAGQSISGGVSDGAKSLNKSFNSLFKKKK